MWLKLLLVIMYVLEGIILCLATYFGFRQKAAKSLIRTIYLLITSAISYVVSAVISPKISRVLVDLLNKVDMDVINSILIDSPETVELCKTLITPYVISLLFPAIFIVLWLLSFIKFSSVSNKIIDKMKLSIKPTLGKIVGAAVGFLNGLIITSIVLIPLCLTCLALGKYSYLSSDADVDLAEHQSYNALTPSSVALNIITNIPSKNLPEVYTDIVQSDINMMHETPWLIEAGAQGADAYKYALERDLSTRESIFCAIGAVNEASGQSKAIPAILTRILLVASERWSEGQEFIGIKLEANNALASSLISSTLDIVKSTNIDNVKSTVRTLMGNGYDKGVINNIMFLSSLQENNGTNISGETAKESADALVDTLISFGQNDDFKEVADSVSEDIKAEYADEAKDKLFPAEATAQEKKEVASTLAEEINAYNKSSIGADDSYDYEAHVDNVAEYIMEIDEKYNYESTESEALMLAISLVSYLESTDDASTASILKYFNFTDAEIDQILLSDK